MYVAVEQEPEWVRLYMCGGFDGYLFSYLSLLFWGLVRVNGPEAGRNEKSPVKTGLKPLKNF
jgi:hypothetical protein